MMDANNGIDVFTSTIGMDFRMRTVHHLDSVIRLQGNNLVCVWMFIIMVELLHWFVYDWLLFPIGWDAPSHGILLFFIQKWHMHVVDKFFTDPLTNE
jgi:hypothetical protein